MNQNRGVWSLHGLTGYFIAVALLLGILVYLTVNAIAVQQATAQQYYEVKDPLTIKRIGPDLENEKHVVVHGKAVAGDVKHKYQFVNK